ILSVEESLPAVGQGALAVQCRAEDTGTRERLAKLDHAATRTTVEAERGFLERLEGGGTVPMAGHAGLEGDHVWLRGLSGHPAGKQLVVGERRGPATEARSLGHSLADELLARGGAALIAEHAGTEDPAGTE